MMRKISLWLAIAVACVVSCAFAQDVNLPPASKIPFKTEATPLEEHGPRVGWVLLAFLAVSGGAMYVLRKKIPSLASNADNDSHIKILKRTRLNPRTTLYVVEFNQRKLLIGQSGDQLVCLDAASTQSQSQDGGCD